MRWLILALSLGTTLATLWRGIMYLITNLGTAGVVPSPFWSAVTLCSGSLCGFIGGVLAFNHKMLSLFFLLAATIMTFLGYPSSPVLAYSFASIFVLTAIYSVMQRHSRRVERYGYEDEYNDDGDEEEYVEADEEEDEVEASKVNYKIPKRRSSYSMTQTSDTLTIKPPQRQRETKVCLTCGVDVPISYKFCPLCGMELYTHPDKVGATSEDMLENVSEDVMEDVTEEKKDETIKILGIDADAKQRDTKRRYRYRAPDDDAESEDENDKKSNENTEMNKNQIINEPERVEVVPVVRKTSSNQQSEITESDDVPFKPLSAHSKKGRSLEVDSSYQSFGRYTQSRKKRKVSLFQRALLVVLIVCIVGSVGAVIKKGTNFGSGSVNVDTSPIRIHTSEDIPTTTVTLENVISEDPPEIKIPDLTPKIPQMEITPAKQIITTTSGINVREGHTTNSKQITQVQANNAFTILDQWKTDNVSSLSAADKNLTGTWYKIQINNGEGWIYGRYALPYNGGVFSLPAGFTQHLLDSFGSNAAEIEAKLGKPTKQQAGRDSTVLDYTGLNITLSQDTVQSIRITGKGHNLTNGLAVGITFDETLKIIGAPNKYNDGVLSYLETANRGILIRRENDGRIRSINVGNI
ncbi:MAG: SH3 domain-containing protein [Synergistaceae bacterium]|nr:SH3 domain-containing protein [Synergistaceae bacterium]